MRVLSERPSVRFSELFEGVTSRSEVVVTFLALLELIRLKQLDGRAARAVWRNRDLPGRRLRPNRRRHGRAGRRRRQPRAPQPAEHPTSRPFRVAWN